MEPYQKDKQPAKKYPKELHHLNLQLRKQHKYSDYQNCYDKEDANGQQQVQHKNRHQGDWMLGGLANQPVV